jgi:hypothetical protein
VIRVVLASKNGTQLDGDVLRIVFDFYTASYTTYEDRLSAINTLCLTCQKWRRIARFYYPHQEMLGIKVVYPDLIEQIEFGIGTLQLARRKNSSSYKDRFSMKVWTEHGKDFLEVLSRLPGTSRLHRIDFDESFNTFHPSLWSDCLRRCYMIRVFSFSSKKCCWDHVKEFLIRFQKQSGITLNQLLLNDISGNSQSAVAPRTVQIFKVQTLEIYRMRSKNVVSDILMMVDDGLKTVQFNKTCVSIESAVEIIKFLSSKKAAKLKNVDVSFMPPDWKEYLSSASPADSLLWPEMQEPTGIFSSALLNTLSVASLVSLTIDGGVFGFSLLTSHHIERVSRLRRLKILKLLYCFDDLQPRDFFSLAHREDRWLSLKYLYVTYRFGDPNWERGQITQLENEFRAVNDLSVETSLSTEGFCLTITRPSGGRATVHEDAPLEYLYRIHRKGRRVEDTLSINIQQDQDPVEKLESEMNIIYGRGFAEGVLEVIIHEGGDENDE